MDRRTAIDKIKKCLALSNSANEHEAAAALRQARSLMEKFNVTDGDVLAADIQEADAKAGATVKPSLWESNLAATVARAFGCVIIFRQGFSSGHWCFVGPATSPEIAQYAFAVLMRQAKKARVAYISASCKRLKTASKTRRADLFCQAWVGAIWNQVADLSQNAESASAIEAYMGTHHADCGDLVAKNRNDGRNLRDKDWDAIQSGAAAGRRAQLHHGVAGNAAPLAIA